MSRLVVMTPNPRGLRHYVDPTSTYDRTFCGRDCSMWPIDIKGGPASCVRCMQTARLKKDIP
jgi:hypothetical protein